MPTPDLLTAMRIDLPDWLTAASVPAAPASDEAVMRLAIFLAGENVARRTGGPFGAAIRDDASGAVIGVGVNLALPTGNPVLHAETVAIGMAAGRLAGSRGVTLFTSCEPCIMCLGASHWAEVARIVSAATKADAEAAGFNEGAGIAELRADMAARGVVFQDGMLRDEAVRVFRLYAEQGGVIYGPAS